MTLVRQSQSQSDDKWEHNLYEQYDPQVSSTGSLSGGERDLREKLSSMSLSQPAVSASAKPKPVAEKSKPVRRSAAAEAHVAETKKVDSTVSKTQVALGVESFLKMLDLEEYSSIFEREEIGMSLVPIMKDRDLLAIGIKEKVGLDFT
uniref:uncharacterized protein LOC122583134 n=1 Tax=Erigeron canadensis TaxID=72917 RepID=UPI001CB92561|nr:uncharacterized protein LOC122583134 [Erigeron canadensis]